MPEHFFSVSSSSESATLGQQASSSMAASHIPVDSPDNSPQPSSSNIQSDKITPTKILQKISPVPKLKTKCTAKRKLNPTHLLTEPAYIAEKLQQQKKKELNGKKQATKEKVKDVANVITQDRRIVKRTNTENKGSPVNSDSNRCCECWENYFLTKKKDDWIKCLNCAKWLHETCSPYKEKCVDCGRKLAREENMKQQS